MESIVPPPTRTRSPCRPARRRIDTNGSGELSGTSIASMPSSISAPAIGSISSGLIPRRIATTGQRRRGHSTIVQFPYLLGGKKQTTAACILGVDLRDIKPATIEGGAVKGAQAPAPSLGD